MLMEREVLITKNTKAPSIWCLPYPGPWSIIRVGVSGFDRAERLRLSAYEFRVIGLAFPIPGTTEAGYLRRPCPRV